MKWWNELPTWQKVALILGAVFLVWLLLRGGGAQRVADALGLELNISTPAPIRPEFNIDRRTLQPEFIIERREYIPDDGMTNPSGGCGCNSGVSVYARENLQNMLDIYGDAMNRLLGGFMDGLVEQGIAAGKVIRFDTVTHDGGSGEMGHYTRVRNQILHPLAEQNR